LKPIYKPTKGPEDWKELLGEPELHWKTGYSARSIAHSWEESGGLPAEIKDTLERSFGSQIEPLIVIPEHKVPMPGSSAGASQNDVFLLCRTNDGTAVVMIEGKVNESFDKTVGEWLGPTPSSGKKMRIEALSDMFGLYEEQYLDLRYQLFHRCASAILEANRFCATYAVMLVHSFSQEHKWFDDFEAFADAIGAVQGDGEIWTAELPSGPLHIGWVTGDPEFLSR
jgi:hypothetical protein